MRLSISVRRLAGTAAATVLGLGMLLSPALAEAGFERWVASFRQTAAESGISRSTYDRAFRGVNSIYHNNGIQTWLVRANGETENVEIS